MSSSSSSAPELPDPAAEAARYALLRRLAHPIRHDLAAHLQPIGMVGELLERRMRAPSADPAQLQDHVTKMLNLSRSAMGACLDVVTWMAPEAERKVPLSTLVKDTVDLLRGGFSFRGLALRNEVGDVPGAVLRAGLRLVLPACLLLMSDEAGPPAEITVSAEATDPDSDSVRLQLSLEPGEGPEPMLIEPPYRRLSAEEVAALARSEGIGLQREGDTIVLAVPLAGTPRAA